MESGFLNDPALDAGDILDGEKRKYGSGSEKGRDSFNEKEYILPEDYGGTSLTLLIQNPQWVFAIWEFSAETKNKLQNINSNELCIRMYYADMDRYFDTKMKSDSKSWYIHVPETNRPYYAEIGVLDNGENFTALARSNVVLMPAESSSINNPEGKPENTDLFNLSGGEGIGKEAGSIFLHKK